jgi:serine/threonine protein kinase
MSSSTSSKSFGKGKKSVRYDEQLTKKSKGPHKPYSKRGSKGDIFEERGHQKVYEKREWKYEKTDFMNVFSSTYKDRERLGAYPIDILLDFMSNTKTLKNLLIKYNYSPPEKEEEIKELIETYIEKNTEFVEDILAYEPIRQLFLVELFQLKFEEIQEDEIILNAKLLHLLFELYEKYEKKITEIFWIANYQGLKLPLDIDPSFVKKIRWTKEYPISILLELSSPLIIQFLTSVVNVDFLETYNIFDRFKKEELLEMLKSSLQTSYIKEYNINRRTLLPYVFNYDVIESYFRDDEGNEFDIKSWISTQPSSIENFNIYGNNQVLLDIETGAIFETPGEGFFYQNVGRITKQRPVDISDVDIIDEGEGQPLYIILKEDSSLMNNYIPYFLEFGIENIVSNRYHHSGLFNIYASREHYIHNLEMKRERLRAEEREKERKEREDTRRKLKEEEESSVSYQIQKAKEKYPSSPMVFKKAPTEVLSERIIVKPKRKLEPVPQAHIEPEPISAPLVQQELPKPKPKTALQKIKYQGELLIYIEALSEVYTLEPYGKLKSIEPLVIKEYTDDYYGTDEEDINAPQGAAKKSMGLQKLKYKGQLLFYIEALEEVYTLEPYGEVTSLDPFLIDKYKQDFEGESSEQQQLGSGLGDKKILYSAGVESKDFVIGNKIGMGRNGEVYEVCFGSDCNYVVKITNLSSNPTAAHQAFEKEYRNQIEASQYHLAPNVILAYLSNDAREGGIIMDKLSVDLKDFIKNPENDLENKINYLKKAVGTLKKLHNIDMTHGDVKLENFMIENETDAVMLIDFGYSNTTRETSRISSKKADDIEEFTNYLEEYLDEYPEFESVIDELNE